MTVNLEEIGLSSIVDQFDLFFIDIWGVVHNGIKLYPDAINVLERLNDKNKDYVLLTNAPRPNSTVINFLKKKKIKKNEISDERIFELAIEARADECKSNSDFHDLKILPDQSIQFPSSQCNAQFQGCHFIRQGVLEDYPEIFNIPSYWNKCSEEKKLFSFLTTTENTHIGTKDLYLKYSN